ncbi:MAG: hypothetical protein SGBAC_008499 [Bacillariaceae sp.]
MKTYIHAIRPNDVKFGRGGNANSNPGNQTVLTRVKGLQPEYKSSSNKKKRYMAIKVVQSVQTQGGRFLKLDPKKPKVWTEATFEEAYQKVSHMFRADHTPEGRARKREKYRTSKKAGGFHLAPQPVQAEDRPQNKPEEHISFDFDTNLRPLPFLSYVRVENPDHMEALRNYGAHQNFRGIHHDQQVADPVAAVAPIYQAPYPNHQQADTIGNSDSRNLYLPPVNPELLAIPQESEATDKFRLDCILDPDLDPLAFLPHIAQEVDYAQEPFEALRAFGVDQHFHDNDDKQLADSIAGSYSAVFQDWVADA